jgi:uncharacterized protein YciI
MRMSFGPIVLSAVLTITAIAPMGELKASAVLSVHSIDLIKARHTPNFIAFAGGYGTIGKNDVEFVKVGFKGIAAQTTGIPELELYHVGFLKKGPAWTATQTDETRQIQSAHMAHINKMASSGKLVAAGPVLDDGDLRGLFVFKVSSLEEAKALTSSDPAVKSGRLAFEVLPWMGPRDIGKKFHEAYRVNPDTKQTMTTHYLGLVRRGSGWKADEAQGVLADHLKFVARLLAEGKARAAGPFAHDVDPRGMYILAASSKEEALQWVAMDPAVKAGHMSIELVAWLVAKEVWP